MIKISKYLYIHITTVILFAVCYYNRNLEIFLLSYGVMLLHETAHLISAVLIGLKPSHIAFYPFGINLRLKNSIVYSIADEVILYASGPFLNVISALLSLFFIKNNELVKVFYFNNIFLFLFNSLPILPMDGGIIAKKILARKIGCRGAEKLLLVLSAILISFLLAIEVFLIYSSSFNFSIIFVCVFLTGNLFTNKEKYHIDFLKELMFFRKKDNFKFRKVKTYIIKENERYNELAKNFSQGSYYIVFEEAKDGKVKRILTEKEIIENLLE